uniref:Putative secreted protein n=1 Tax=Ixodes scapularis TaxID=6945 RepID=A0A4D5S6M1_IXOSC
MAPRPRAPVGAASAGLQPLAGSLGRGLGFGSPETSGYLASRGCPSSRLLSSRVHTRNAFDHLGQAKFLQRFFWVGEIRIEL